MALGAFARSTLAFYEWEILGRGWHLREHPVPLEPPFHPYRRLRIAGAGAPDDGRRPTWLSSLLEPAGPSGPQDEDEQALAPLEYAYRPLEEPLVELGLELGRESKVPRGAAHAWLRSISVCGEPVSFELHGAQEAVRLLVVVRRSDAALVSDSLRSYFPDLGLVEGGLSRRWHSVEGVSAVLEFGLGREFMLPLRQPGPDPDALTPLVGALASVRPDEVAVVQVLFEEVKGPWAENVMRSVTTPRGEPFFADAPGLTDRARAKVETRSTRWPFASASALPPRSASGRSCGRRREDSHSLAARGTTSSYRSRGERMTRRSTTSSTGPHTGPG